MYMREYLAYGFHMHARLWKIRVIGYPYGWKQTLLMVLAHGHFRQQPIGYAVPDIPPVDKPSSVPDIVTASILCNQRILPLQWFGAVSYVWR